MKHPRDRQYRSSVLRAGSAALGRTLLVACSLSVAACGSHAAGRPAEAASGAPVHPIDATDDSFAPTVGELLLKREPSPERLNKLVGVVRYQLARAGALLESGHDAAGLDAMEGALYLVRAGEFHPSMIDGRMPALALAAAAVARKGTEGRALAVYSMLDRILPKGADRTEVEAHLSAIKTWEEKTRSRGPLQAAGGDARNSLQRALWDPSPDIVRAARAGTIEWIDRAIGYSKEQTPPSDDFEREEAIEAYRAIRTGAMALAALYLRNGDPAGAIDAMDSPHVARVVSPHLHDALRRAAEDDDAEAWLELFSTFDRLGATETDVTLDPELARAAAWGSAVELYRVEPETMRGVMPIATLLMRHGMSEVTPVLLSPVVAKTTEAEIASWALGYVLEALMMHDAVGDLAAARRTFQKAAPILAAVEKRPTAKDVSPSVARVRYAMGALEARAGELLTARPLIEAALRVEPTLPGFELLGAIDRQRGDDKAALGSLENVVKIATESSDPDSIAAAELTAFEIYRDRGNAAEAAKALEVALHRALDAQKLARSAAEQATAERILARVLERYGNLDGARRATMRAYEASRGDLRQMTATVLEAARRGLIRSDLRGTREAARHAIEANLAADDLVYVALWLRILEHKLGVPSDGTVEEAFAKIDEDDGWAARLRSWGAGRLSDEQLLASARSRVEQTEASFYVAMAAYAMNDARAAERLDRVAKSEAIELVEVGIARDLSDKRRLDLKLPSGVDVP
jgi:tetratricopeptide (TPR) repeat protein